MTVCESACVGCRVHCSSPNARRNLSYQRNRISFALPAAAADQTRDDHSSNLNSSSTHSGMRDKSISKGAGKYRMLSQRGHHSFAQSSCSADSQGTRLIFTHVHQPPVPCPHPRQTTNILSTDAVYYLDLGDGKRRSSCGYGR